MTAGRSGSKVTAGLVRRLGVVKLDTAELVQRNQTPPRYSQTSTAEFPTDADVAENIVEEGAWAAVVVQPNATSSLLEARQVGGIHLPGSLGSAGVLCAGPTAHGHRQLSPSHPYGRSGRCSLCCVRVVFRPIVSHQLRPDHSEDWC